MEGTDPAMAAHISDKQIMCIAYEARVQWEDIAINLGFERPELSGYEFKFRDDLDRRLRAVLFDWKMREENPTVGKVLKACEDAKVGAAAKQALLKIK
jgi:hypothetical protein